MSNRKRNKTSLFIKIYLGVTIAALAVIVVIWGVLWSFLKAYEASQPQYKIEQIVDALNNGQADEYTDYIHYQVNRLEDDNTYKKYITDKLGSGNIEYTRKSGEYSKDTPVYQLKDGNNPVGVVYLKKSDTKAKFNTPIWEIDRIDNVIGQTKDYTVTVPKGTVISVNGIDLDETYIIEDNAECKNLGNVTKYITAPKMTVYQLTGLAAQPDIKAIGPVYNSELSVESEDNGQIVYGFESTDSLKTEQQDRIITITKTYGNYVTNDVGYSALSPYILPGSYATSYLKNIAKTNIWTASHSANDFDDLTVYNYQIYTDTCFSCEVKFNLVIHTWSQDFTYPTHIKYVFIKSGNAWYVADISLKSDNGHD